MGVEVYFQPVFNKDKPTYHLCLFIKNLKGYENLNRIITIANSDYFYYKPIVTFELLEDYNEGIICSSACVGGLIPQLIANNKKELAIKATKKFVNIYGKDFYFEIQPYKLFDSPGLQEKVNIGLIKLSEKYDVPCVLTSDSHYGNKEDFPSYLKMHEIAGRTGEALDKIKLTYSERYMPELTEMPSRFKQMHPTYKHMVKEFKFNIEGLVNSIDDDILELLPLQIPKFIEGVDSGKLLKDELVKGLKAKGKYNKKYLAQVKEEYDVILHHGFEDYFLIVQDYVKWAKDNDIAVGPGRGSVCNSIVAYALDITNVDPIYFNLDFKRFLRKDKKKLPDIDLDFETARRPEVIKYIIDKYPGRAVQICSYGLYKVDNLINDLCKTCSIKDSGEKANLKTLVNKHVIEGVLQYEDLIATPEARYYNKTYDNVINHFSNLFKQVRFIGTHAAGVAIVADDIIKYTAIQKRKDNFSSSYDLANLEKINAIKFDILGLKTMSEIKELEVLTGEILDYSWFEDKELLSAFGAGNTVGIFQFEKAAARSILTEMDADCMEDVIAASALNRPGPLSLKMPELYAENKKDSSHMQDSKYWEYTKETYGTIVYQEQIMAICRNIGEMEYEDIDKVMKMLKGSSIVESVLKKREAEEKDLRDKFKKGAKNHGINSKEADDLFDKMLVYSFNKGHATGYGIISVQNMHYKINHPLEFWFMKMKYAPTEQDLGRFRANAVQSDCLLMLPHVNFTANFSIGKMEGEKVIREGLCSIKNVGLKAAEVIEKERLKNGRYKTIDEFISRVPKRSVNSRVINSLIEHGALEFDKKVYMKRVIKYNSALYMRGMGK